MGSTYSKFGVGVPFDPEYSLVTSPIFAPPVLASLRLLFGFYYIVYFIFKLSWDSVHIPQDLNESVPRAAGTIPFTSDLRSPQVLFLFHSLVRHRPLRLLLGGWCPNLQVCVPEEIPLAPLAQVLPVSPSLAIRNRHLFSCVHSQYPLQSGLAKNPFCSLCYHHRLLGPTRFVCLFLDPFQRYHQFSDSLCLAAHTVITL